MFIPTAFQMENNRHKGEGIVDAASKKIKRNKVKNQEIKPNTIFICGSSIEFMKQFKYYKIEKENPLIDRNLDLKRVIDEKIVVNKLFDNILCNQFERFFTEKASKEFVENNEKFKKKDFNVVFKLE